MIRHIIQSMVAELKFLFAIYPKNGNLIEITQGQPSLVVVTAFEQGYRAFGEVYNALKGLIRVYQGI